MASRKQGAGVGEHWPGLVHGRATIDDSRWCGAPEARRQGFGQVRPGPLAMQPWLDEVTRWTAVTAARGTSACALLDRRARLLGNGSRASVERRSLERVHEPEENHAVLCCAVLASPQTSSGLHRPETKQAWSKVTAGRGICQERSQRNRHWNTPAEEVPKPRQSEAPS